MPKKLVFALDVPNESSADLFIESIGDEVYAYKIGLELFTATGPALFRKYPKMKFVLDMKYHDIPETVERATKAAMEHENVCAITYHIQQSATISKIVELTVGSHVRPLFVTVLTSMCQEDLRDLRFFDMDPAERVQRLFEWAYDLGARGFVCSPLEVASLKKLRLDSFVMVPGIRLADAGTDDQKRVATPDVAVKNGADLIVVGRNIRNSKNPRSTAIEINNMIE